MRYLPYKVNMDLTIHDVYNYLHQPVSDVMYQHEYLVEIPAEELEAAVDALEEDSRERLLMCVESFITRSRLIRMVAPKQTVTEPVSFKNANMAQLFTDKAKREDYTEALWKLREEFFEELSKASCTGCARGALIRKYISKCDNI